MERTYLAQYHLSLALLEVSVYISQFYTLASFGVGDVHFEGIGKPFSCALIIWAAVCNITGAVRFFRTQDRILTGRKVCAGGWDLMAEGIGVFVVCLFSILEWRCCEGTPRLTRIA